MFPSTVVTVITAVPFDTAVTTPISLTVATLSLLLEYVTFLLLALLGVICGVSVNDSPAAVSVPVVGVTFTPSTFTIVDESIVTVKFLGVITFCIALFVVLSHAEQNPSLVRTVPEP